MQGNVSMQLDNENVQVFVDAAIAKLNKTEEINLKSMSHMYQFLYGFWPTENIMPNGEIVSWEAFGHQLCTEDSELSFNKPGRTTGLPRMSTLAKQSKNCLSKFIMVRILFL